MRKGLGRHNYRSAGGLIPSLVLDFAGTGTLDSRVTFTRSTTGTYYNSSGVLSTAAINAPRFDYDPITLNCLGLLVEQSSTNLLTYSQDFTNVVWVKSLITITPNATTAPDGTTTAGKLNETAGTGDHVCYKLGITTSNATPNTWSIYAKAAERSIIWISAYSNGTNFFTWFNLSTGTVLTNASGSTATITLQANGFYRCTVTRTTTSAIAAFSFGITTTDGVTSYAGTAGSGIYIWGAQLEALAFPTSYIPTTSAQVTRAADLSPLTVGSWYNTSQGTWFAQVNMLSTAGTPRIVGATPSSKAPMEISNQSAAMFDNVFGVSTANTITANTTQKIATAWTGTTGQVCLNGGTVATGSQTNGYANLSTIGIGYNSTSSDNFINGRIAKITYYPQALTSAQLQALTGP
jgi:hypothetical protein